VIPVYCINLARSPERLAFMQAQLGGQGIIAERIVGQDGAVDIPLDWRWQFKGAPLSPGKIGCYVSQLLALQAFIASSAPWCVVLQDDVTLADGFMAIAEAAIAAAPPQADVIHLCSVFKRRPRRLVPLPHNSWLVRHRRLPVGAGAVAFSREAAFKLLYLQPRQRTFDLELRYAWLHDLDIYGVEPAPAHQAENFPSLIGPHHLEDRTQRRQWRPNLLSRLYGWFYVQYKLARG
jgi:glycosyl transferase family 25